MGGFSVASPRFSSQRGQRNAVDQFIDAFSTGTRIKQSRERAEREEEDSKFQRDFKRKQIKLQQARLDAEEATLNFRKQQQERANQAQLFELLSGLPEEQLMRDSAVTQLPGGGSAPAPVAERITIPFTGMQGEEVFDLQPQSFEERLALAAQQRELELEQLRLEQGVKEQAEIRQSGGRFFQQGAGGQVEDIGGGAPRRDIRQVGSQIVEVPEQGDPEVIFSGRTSSSPQSVAMDIAFQQEAQLAQQGLGASALQAADLSQLSAQEIISQGILTPQQRTHALGVAENLLRASPEDLLGLVQAGFFKTQESLQQVAGGRTAAVLELMRQNNIAPLPSGGGSARDRLIELLEKIIGN